MQGSLHAAQEVMVLLGVEQREVASSSDMTPSEAGGDLFRAKEKEALLHQALRDIRNLLS